jgi:quercetin dioxygenase-like cupin family protein
MTTRRTFVAAAMTAIPAAAIAATTPRSFAFAQEVTTVATPELQDQPIMFLGAGRPASAPGHLLTVFRFELEPGQVVPPHRHPGVTNLHIEVGTMTFRLYEGAATVLRGGQIAEPLPAGTETLLETGDGIFYDFDAIHEASNPDPTPNRVLSVTLMDESQPATIPVDVEE